MESSDEKKNQEELSRRASSENAGENTIMPDLFVDVGHIPRKYIWRSCCLMLDSRAVLFFSQLAISIGIMLFCIHQMSVLGDAESQRNYGMLLTFMVGLWFPAPRIGQ